MIDKKLKLNKILVVAGGWSDEREVSLMSGKNIFSCLKKNNFNVKFLDLNIKNLDQILVLKPDIIFNSLHGTFGEDGGLNSFAHKNNIIITHSDGISSALCFNKRLLKNYLKKKLNVLSPKEIIYNKPIKFPVISKPNWGGSSKGIKFINNNNDLKIMLNNNETLIEEFINGKELTVTVLDNKPLTVTEILPEKNEAFYNYSAKYSTGGSLHNLPAKIPIKLEESKTFL